MLQSVIGLAGFDPVDPSGDQARRELRHELSRGRYLEADSLIDRLGSWLTEMWDRLFGVALGGGFPTAVLLLVLILVVAGLSWLLPRTRRARRRAQRAGAVLPADTALDASGYRARAARALAQGRHDDAALDGFRAIAADAVRRTLVDPAPGLTAHEIATVLVGPFPGQVEEIHAAAGLFDTLCYGGGHTTAEAARSVLALDRDLAATRPTAPAAPAGPHAAEAVR